MKVLYIYKHVSPSKNFNRLGWIWAVIAWGSRGIARYHSLREELLVLNAPAIFCWLLFFVEKTVWQHTLELLEQLLITSPKSTKSLPVGTIAKSRKKGNRNKTKIRVGTSVTVKVVYIDENIREGKIKRTRDELFGCLAHITSVLFLSQFWWLVPVFSLYMAKSCKGLLRNSHTRIDNFDPIIRLSDL